MNTSIDSVREFRSRRPRSVRMRDATQPQVEALENKSLLSTNLAGAVVSVGGSNVVYEFSISSGNVYYNMGGAPPSWVVISMR